MDMNIETNVTAGAETQHEGGGRRKRAVAGVIEDLCTGCGICLKSCPVSCITIVESGMNFNGMAHIGIECTGCNICAIDCPWFAIEMINPDGSRKSPAEYAKQARRLRGYQ
jgi:NAD-dependent dihydropyrimidine dehydrogenase PreA subunit